jgi:hypothetical protein
LIQGTPGRRFQERYLRGRRAAHSAAKRIAKVATGAVLIAAGIVLLPAPGPGILVVLLGLALVAESSPRVAKTLDRIELRVRGLIKTLRA